MPVNSNILDTRYGLRELKGSFNEGGTNYILIFYSLEPNYIRLTLSSSTLEHEPQPEPDPQPEPETEPEPKPKKKTETEQERKQ